MITFYVHGQQSARRLQCGAPTSAKWSSA